MNPLPRADPTGGGRRLDPLRAIALAALGGALVWSLMNPAQSARLARRYSPV